MSPSVLQLAQKAFICDAGRLLLVQKSSSDPEQPDAWEVPGGRLEPDESLDEHLMREVFEEVGLRVEAGPPFVMWDWTMAGRGEHAGSRVRVVAIGRRCTPLTVQTDDQHRTEDDYLGEARWVPLADVAGYALIPSLVAPMARFLEGLAGAG